MGKLYSLISALLLAVGVAFAAPPSGYEWWFDDDVSSVQSGELSGSTLDLQPDVSSLPKGIHYFNLRLSTDEGAYGAVYRKMFLNLSGSVNAVAYEYWLDNNYESKTEGSLSDGDNSYLVNLDGVRKGLHRFNYRVRTGEGTWGSLFSKYFYIASNAARFTEYEYWLDKDYANRKSATVTSNPVAFDVDLSGFEKRGGAHSFNLRVRDGDGEWGSVYSKLLVFKTNDGLVPIIGYRHYINGEDLGYVEVERTVTDMYMFEVDLADDMLIGGNGGNIVFDGDNVSVGGTGQLSYTLQIRTELGWAVPEQWDVDVDNAFSTTAVEMQVNSMRTFPTPDFGKFVAVKFTAIGSPLYFRADTPIEFDIYRNGELVSSLSATQVAEMAAVSLDAGEYFGVLHDAGVGTPDEFTFHIMDTPNIVPAPEISFYRGMVEITCAMDEAVIHYSVDGNAPSTDSDDNIYTGPFSMERNGVIMAVACIPDLDLDPSEIATYTVDSYKTATPYGQFDAATRLLTIFCDTEGAVISYAYDPDGEWTVYRAPITIAGNVTVYARAIRDGYHDSEMVVIEVSEFKCEPVAISYNGRYVTLSTGDPHATIMYSTDGSHPADGLTYTSPFDVAGLCRIRVMAVKDGYMDSDISEYEVTGYADGEHAVTSAGGVLRSCYEWTGNGFTDNLRSLRVEGVLNDDDYAFLRSMGAMHHLDLEKVIGAQIPDRAFAGTGLISISMPESIAQYGSGVLEGTANLCAVIWNSTTESLGIRLTADIDNPNVLLYVCPGVGVEDQRGLNVIEDGLAESVTLHYGHPYHAPRDFHASRVSMTRDFSLPTEIGNCGGWETIVLPFTPDSITHERAGAITPFAVWDGDVDGSKPFWLYASSSGGWWEAMKIEACVPYIISMPNNPRYIEAYNLAGRVTFSASDVTLGPDTNEPMCTAWGSYRLVGTFMPVEEPDVRALNVTSPEEGILAGSMFVDYEEAVPFGAYVTGAGPRRAIPVFGDWNGLRIPVVENGGLTVDSPSHGTIRIHSTCDRQVDIITVDGMAVCTLSIRAGETVMVEDLLRNYYICGGIKVLVR